MDEQTTQGDVDRLLHALKREREARKQAERDSIQLRDAMLSRLEALETRPAPLGPILDGLAAIRRDVEASLAAMRSEIDDLHEQVQSFVREG